MTEAQRIAREFVAQHRRNGSWTMTLTEWDALEVELVRLLDTVIVPKRGLIGLLLGEKRVQRRPAS